MNAICWSCYTCKGQTDSDRLANSLYESAIRNFLGKRISTDCSDSNPAEEGNFYILRKSHCVAVLTEDFDMDNYSDLEYIQNRSGKQACIDTHLDGITKYIERE